MIGVRTPVAGTRHTNTGFSDHHFCRCGRRRRPAAPPTAALGLLPAGQLLLRWPETAPLHLATGPELSPVRRNFAFLGCVQLLATTSSHSSHLSHMASPSQCCVSAVTRGCPPGLAAGGFVLLWHILQTQVVTLRKGSKTPKCKRTRGSFPLKAENQHGCTDLAFDLEALWALEAAAGPLDFLL